MQVANAEPPEAARREPERSLWEDELKERTESEERRNKDAKGEQMHLFKGKKTPQKTKQRKTLINQPGARVHSAFLAEIPAL